MSKLVSLFVLVFLFVGLGNVWGQELTEEEKQIIEERYFGCEETHFGVQKMMANDFSGAIVHFEKSKEFYREKKLWHPLSNSYVSIMKMHYFMGDYLKAVAEGEAGLKAIDGYEEAISTKIAIYNNIAMILAPIEETELAIKYSEEGLQFIREFYQADTIFMIAPLANGLGFNYGLLGNLEKSDEMYDLAEKVLDYLGDCQYCIEERSTFYNNKGTTYRRKGNYEHGFELLEKSTNLSEKLHGKDSPELIVPYTSVGRAYLDYGQSDKASYYFNRLLSIIDDQGEGMPLNYEKYKTNAFYNLGFINSANENHEQAIQYLEAARKNSTKTNEPDINLITGIVEESKIYVRMGDFFKAQQFLNKADSTFSATGYKENTLLQKEILTDIALATAYFYEMKKEMQQAKEIRLKIYRDKDSQLNSNRLASNLVQLSKIYEKTEQFDSTLYFSHIAMLRDPKAIITDLEIPSSFEDLLAGSDSYMVLHRNIEVLTKAALQSVDKNEQQQYFERIFQVVDLHDKYHLKNLKNVNFFLAGSSKSIVEESIKVYKASFKAAMHYYIDAKEEKGKELAFLYAQKSKAQQLLLSQLDAEASSYSNIDKRLIDKEHDLLVDIQFYEQKLYKISNYKCKVYTPLFKLNKKLFSGE